MNRYLLFQLYSPWCSWGEVAVGEVRPSEVRPSRSALLGLLAAALGLRREDEERHAALSDCTLFAVLVESQGVVQVDYHTTQTSTPRRGQVHRSRPDQLDRPRSELATILSRRHYRADALYRIAVAHRGDGDPSVEELRDALLRPVFPLYLGRKSCPPALPLAPAVIEAQDLAQALTEYSPITGLGSVAEGLRRLRRRSRPQLFWDENFPAPGRHHEQRFDRRDAPSSRSRRLFQVRRELSASLPTEEKPRVPESSAPQA